MVDSDSRKFWTFAELISQVVTVYSFWNIPDILARRASHILRFCRYDEATSAFDRRNENLIQHTNKVITDKILITVAHILQTIKTAIRYTASIKEYNRDKTHSSNIKVYWLFKIKFNSKISDIFINSRFCMLLSLMHETLSKWLHLNSCIIWTKWSFTKITKSILPILTVML